VSEDEDEDDDNDSSAMIISNLFPHGPGVGGGGCDGDEYGEEEGNGEDNDVYFLNTDDADSVPDAEVNKYSFLERLRHYMEGNKISDANRKCVEWTILFKVGTLVRNMDKTRTADMEARIFGKYVNIVWALRTNTSRATQYARRCCIDSRLVSRICVVEICCVGGRMKQPTSDHSSTNFWESVRCLTCQVDPIRSEEAVHCFSLGGGESGEIHACAVICRNICYS
jgi:hypothetical protein